MFCSQLEFPTNSGQSPAILSVIHERLQPVESAEVSWRMCEGLRRGRESVRGTKVMLDIYCEPRMRINCKDALKENCFRDITAPTHETIS
jgi:hypothetical protein